MINPERLVDNKPIPKDFNLVGEVLDKNQDFDQKFLLYRYDSILIIFGLQEYRSSKGKIYRNQMCVPLSSVNWIVGTISQFYTPPSKGGQPAGKIGEEAIFDDEKILLNRAVNVDGTGMPGFRLSNLSRSSYVFPDKENIKQNQMFTDDFLRNSNFLDLLASIADK